MEVNDNQLQAEVQQAKLRFGIVGNAPALLAAVSRAIQVAPIDLSVLITGESGTGKEFFPKIIHQFSARKHAKYIAVNCGAIPEGTIDSELFGHEKGAFTGAVATRKGYFEEADGGTIFLDEVGELPLTTQARLLRVLESGEFIKVGSSTVQKSNVRIVAATNVNMARAVAEGRFREDLYYRLSTVTIAVPPLRERGTDILLLARKFAADFSEKYLTPQVTFSDDARRLLMQYRWPGNVRQLKNVIDQTSLFDAGRMVEADDLSSYLPRDSVSYTPAIVGDNSHDYLHEREMLFSMMLGMQREIDKLKQEIEQLSSPAPKPLIDSIHIPPAETHEVSNVVTPEPTEPAATVQPMGHSLVRYAPQESIFARPATAATPGKTLEDTERETIVSALERNGGRRKATARELNISERTLYRKIKEYGIE